MDSESIIDKESLDYIHNGVQKLYIKQVFKPIVESILIRRTYAFKLSFSEVKHDIETLKKHLKSIIIEEFYGEEAEFSGFYSADEKNIRLSLTCLKDYLLTEKAYYIYSLIAHELSHALCKDEDDNDILAIREDQNGKTDMNKFDEKMVNRTLLELIVSEIGERLTAKRKQKSVYTSQSSSYSKTSEMLELLEASYGVKEEDLINTAVRGRTELAKFFSERSKESLETVLSNLDRFELNYSFIHNTLYMPESDKPPMENRYINFGRGCVCIYELCADIMNTRIENMNISTIEDATTALNRLKFDFNKLDFLMNNFAKRIADEENVERFVDDLFEETNKTKYMLAKKICAMQKVLDNPNVSKDKKLEELTKIKNTNPKDIELQEFEEEDIKSFSFEIDSQTLNYYKEEDINWNNETIFEYIQSKLGKEVAYKYKQNKALNNQRRGFKEIAKVFGYGYMEIAKSFKEMFQYVFHRISSRKQKRLPEEIKKENKPAKVEFVQKVDTPKISKLNKQIIQEEDKIKE